MEYQEKRKMRENEKETEDLNNGNSIKEKEEVKKNMARKKKVGLARASKSTRKRVARKGGKASKKRKKSLREYMLGK